MVQESRGSCRKAGSLGGAALNRCSHSATFQVSHTHSGFFQLYPRLQRQCSRAIPSNLFALQGWSVCDVSEVTRARLLWGSPRSIKLRSPGNSATLEGHAPKSSFVSPSVGALVLDRLSELGQWTHIPGNRTMGDRYGARVQSLMSRRPECGSGLWFLWGGWLSTPVL